MEIKIWLYEYSEPKVLECRNFNLKDGFLLVVGGGWIKAFNLRDVQYFEYERASEREENHE